jgi:hypothetical protein
VAAGRLPKKKEKGQYFRNQSTRLFQARGDIRKFNQLSSTALTEEIKGQDFLTNQQKQFEYK